MIMFFSISTLLIGCKPLIYKGLSVPLMVTRTKKAPYFDEIRCFFYLSGMLIFAF